MFSIIKLIVERREEVAGVCALEGGRRPHRFFFCSDRAPTVNAGEIFCLQAWKGDTSNGSSCINGQMSRGSYRVTRNSPAVMDINPEYMSVVFR